METIFSISALVTLGAAILLAFLCRRGFHPRGTALGSMLLAALLVVLILLAGGSMHLCLAAVLLPTLLLPEKGGGSREL